MNLNLSELLTRTDAIMTGGSGWRPVPDLLFRSGNYRGKIHIGVDLGSAHTVLVMFDENNIPIAGGYQFAQVTHDGPVMDFVNFVTRLGIAMHNH